MGVVYSDTVFTDTVDLERQPHLKLCLTAVEFWKKSMELQKLKGKKKLGHKLYNNIDVTTSLHHYRLLDPLLRISLKTTPTIKDGISIL